MLIREKEELDKLNSKIARYEDFGDAAWNTSENTICFSKLNNHEIFKFNEEAITIINKYKKPVGELKCYELFQGKGHPCQFCVKKNFDENSEYKRDVFGEINQKYYQISCKPVIVKGEAYIVSVATDVNDEKLYLNEIDERLIEEKYLNNCIRILHSDRTPEESIEDTLEAIGRYFQADRVTILEVSSDGKMNYIFEWNEENIEGQANLIEALEKQKFDIIFEEFDRGGFFYYNAEESNYEFTENSLYWDLHHTFGLDSMLGVPWTNSKGATKGILAIDNPRESSGNYEFLTTLASFVADFLDKKEMYEKLSFLSFFDSLSGIGNRHGYNKLLKELERKQPKHVGVALIDINGLKIINEENGQSYGDAVIKELTSIMYENFGVATYRISGDEFSVIDTVSEKEEFVAKTNKMKEKAKIQGIDICVGDIWSSNNPNVLELIEQADAKLYLEKKSTNNIKRAADSYKKALVDNLLAEIDNNKFVVYLQPQVNLESMKLIGAEALIRKLDDNGKIIPPDNFIPFYEYEDIISYVDFFAMETICAKLKEWEKSIGLNLNEFSVAVNFSRVTLKEEDVAKKIKDVCDKHQIHPSTIIVEVTERIDELDGNRLSLLVEELLEMGFIISLDDFGSGHSNLSVLTSTNFGEVKIDKSIVQSITDNKKSYSIAKLIVSMCKDLDINHTLAEGIETEEQLDFVKAINCKLGQGYLFGRPIPIDEFAEIHIKDMRIK